MKNIEKNSTFISDVVGYSSEGYGVCRPDGRAVFIKGALAGERWQARVIKSTGSAVYARGERLITPSPERVLPACQYFGRCGGCDTMHMSCGEELRFKLGKVSDALRRIGALELAADEIIPSDNALGYRNKAIYAVGTQAGRTVYGFYRCGTHDIIPIDRCLLQRESADTLARAVCAFMDEHGIAAYDPATGRGAVRHIFTRAARDGGAVLCIVSARGFGAQTESLCLALSRACPELRGIVLDINKAPGNTVLAGSFYTLWGDAELTDTLCGNVFEIAPQAFYQVNPRQAEKLYEKAVALAAPTVEDTVLDLYCGAGTISLRLARDAGRVIGAEIVPEAIENAKRNAAANGVSNAEFICADAGEAARILKARGIIPSAVVVDPPRKGMSPEAVEAVAAMRPERIVYVSCDPATLARDLKRFDSLGYRARSAAAVDMFPRTCHVETVVLITRNI